ncbi:MAG: hypothetical protein MUC43_12860, partial [Pirellula sp.]|nr:hypothetical protein [Pirellula sp.]
MSQATFQTKQNSPPEANGAVSRETLLSFLVGAAKSMRRIEIGIGLVGWFTILLMLLLSAVLIDHWLLTLNVPLRSLFFASLIAWSFWWVPKRLIPVLVRPIHPEHAARKIELQHPEMKESLISWLQLSTANEHTPKGVLAAVGRFAARNLKGSQSDSILDNGNLLKLTTFFVASLLAFAIYSFSAPKSSLISVARILMPWAAINPATRVSILEVAPGSTTITQGTNLAIRVSTRGVLKQDAVSLRFDLSDGQRIGETLPLKPEVEGLSYQINFGESIGGVHQPLTYWIEAGDAVAGPFQVKIQTVPIVAIDRIELIHPKYTALKNRTINKDGSFEVPEGTLVKLFAHVNQPMERARIEFDPVVEKGILIRTSRLLDLAPNAMQLEGEWYAKLNEQKNSPTIERYRVRATNNLGEQNIDPIIFQTKILADLPPTVRLQSDLPSQLDLPSNGTLNIEVRANDPDYGLSSVSIFGKNTANLVAQKASFEEQLFNADPAATGQIVRTFEFTPSRYSLRAGDQIELAATAVDNRCAPGSDVPEPNVVYSSPIRIRIVEPIKGDDKNQKVDDKNPAAEKEEAKKPPTQRGLMNRGNEKKPQSNQGSNNQSDSTENQESSGEQQSNPGQSSSSSGSSKKEQNNEKEQNKGKQSGDQSTGSAGGDGSDGQTSDEQSNQTSAGNSSQNSKGNSSNQNGGDSQSSNSSSSSETGNSSAGGQNESNGSNSKDQEPLHDGQAFEEINKFQNEKKSSNNEPEQNANNETSGKDDPSRNQSGGKNSSAGKNDNQKNGSPDSNGAST